MHEQARCSNCLPQTPHNYSKSQDQDENLAQKTAAITVLYKEQVSIINDILESIKTHLLEPLRLLHVFLIHIRACVT